MFRSIAGVGVWLALATAGAIAADAKYSVKTNAMAAPKELKEPIAKLLGENSVQVLDDKGNVLMELWLRKEIPAKATAAQIKNGLTYRELEETTLLGAIRFPQPATDYRKQKIKAGVYTLRLGFQPMDGDHMGTAPHPEFCLISPAAMDEKPDPMAAKELHDMSSKSATGSHPGVFLLFPNGQPQDAPKLVTMDDKWVLQLKEPVNCNGQPAMLGLALTVVGHAE